MKTVFADTWFFQAMLSDMDAHHAEVVAYLDDNDDFIVTTRWVMVEVANAFSASSSRDRVAGFLQAIESDPGVMIVGGSDDLFQRGLKLYAARADKSWSLTDCMSFVVMEEHRIRLALTGDHHFEQAGFDRVFGRR